MNLRKLATKAKDTMDKRGGVESLKADAEELKKVAKGDGSLSDKAKAAAKALKEPGAKATDSIAADVADHEGAERNAGRRGAAGRAPHERPPRTGAGGSP